MPTLEELSQQVDALSSQVRDLQTQVNNLGGGGDGGVTAADLIPLYDKLTQLSAITNLDETVQIKQGNTITVTTSPFYIYKNDPRTVYYSNVGPDMLELNLESFSRQPVASDSVIVYLLENNPFVAATLQLGAWSNINGSSVFIDR